MRLGSIVTVRRLVKVRLPAVVDGGNLPLAWRWRVLCRARRGDATGPREQPSAAVRAAPRSAGGAFGLRAGLRVRYRARGASTRTKRRTGADSRPSPRRARTVMR